MSFQAHSSDAGPSRRVRGRALLAALLAAAALAACGGGGGGGGGDSSAVPTGAAASDTVSQGAITGFGSIIVNGVRYDDSAAAVSDEDEDDNPSRSKDDLRLGMVVTVSGSSGTSTGSASAVAYGSELKGPVQSIGGSTGTATVAGGSQTLVILGQTVVVGPRTVFDPLSLAGGFGDIRPGNVLEVHGYLDAAANRLLATRINRESGASHYKITGTISSLNSGSRSFRIGSETFLYGAIEQGRLRVEPANGLTVKVRLSVQQAATSTWTATRIKPAARKALENNRRVEVEGLINAFTSTTRFSVNGMPVDASSARFPKGPAGLALGARVEVKGSVVNGTLIAIQVKVEDDADEDNEIELYGTVSALNTGARTFVVRGVTVSYPVTVRFERGSASNLVNGARVEVKASSAPVGSTVQAQRIKFEN